MCTLSFEGSCHSSGKLTLPGLDGGGLFLGAGAGLGFGFALGLGGGTICLVRSYAWILPAAGSFALVACQ